MGITGLFKMSLVIGQSKWPIANEKNEKKLKTFVF